MAENYGTYVTPMHQTGGYDPRILLDASEEQRLDLMRRMGVANTEPQLPHSPALKAKKTGVIYPWLEILAKQSDQFVCCDVDGCEDEDVWGPKVVDTYVDNRTLAVMAQAQALQRKAVQDIQAPYKMAEQKGPASRLTLDDKSEYEKQGVKSFKDIEYEQEADSTTGVTGSERPAS